MAGVSLGAQTGYGATHLRNCAAWTVSKLHSFADGWRHIRFVLLMKPLPFIAVPGFLLSLVGLLLMTFFYIGGDIESSYLHSWCNSHDRGYSGRPFGIPDEVLFGYSWI